MMEKEIKEGIEEIRFGLQKLKEKLDLEGKKNKLQELQTLMSDPETWKNRERGEETAKTAGEISNFLEEVERAEKIVRKMEAKGTEELYYEARRAVKTLETKTLFTGKYDRGGAVVTIQAGAGGQDASDWAAMLMKMYQGYAERAGFKTRVIEENLDDFQGRTGRKPIKNATMEVKGEYAYGYIKGEAGVHRLVRISPFSAKGLRHTSFALVEVLPDMPETEEADLKIAEEDLKIDLFRAGGPGGQNVNKVETAVRITHLPTRIVAASQVERSQSGNRERAMKLLKARISKQMEAARVKEIRELKTKAKPEWGSQIRSYVLHPYKMVKDHRTETETSDVEGVLEGKLEEFIEAETEGQK